MGARRWLARVLLINGRVNGRPGGSSPTIESYFVGPGTVRSTPKRPPPPRSGPATAIPPRRLNSTGHDEREGRGKLVRIEVGGNPFRGQRVGHQVSGAGLEMALAIFGFVIFGLLVQFLHVVVEEGASRKSITTLHKANLSMTMLVKSRRWVRNTIS